MIHRLEAAGVGVGGGGGGGGEDGVERRRRREKEEEEDERGECGRGSEQEEEGERGGGRRRRVWEGKRAGEGKRWNIVGKEKVQGGGGGGGMYITLGVVWGRAEAGERLTKKMAGAMVVDPQEKEIHSSRHLKGMTDGHPFRPTLAAAKGIGDDTTNLVVMDLTSPAYMVWGATTDVGKTVVSGGLAAAALRSRSPSASAAERHVTYVKPVQTGFPADSDSRAVYTSVVKMMMARNGDGVDGIVTPSATSMEPRLPSWLSETSALTEMSVWQQSVGREGEGEGEAQAACATRQEDTRLFLECLTLWAWKNPVSPHLAVEMEGGLIKDETVVEGVKNVLWHFARQGKGQGQGKGKGGLTCPGADHEHGEELRRPVRQDSSGSLSIVETAGGVASPGPSGTLQCDLYRPLRMPALLVGDGRLGGISTTISSYELLRLRGYDVDAVVMIDYGLGNAAAVRRHLPASIVVVDLPLLPAAADSSPDPLDVWLLETEGRFMDLLDSLKRAHQSRRARREELARTATEILWWPFTQHGRMREEDVTVIDSRLGDSLAVWRRVPHVSSRVDRRDQSGGGGDKDDDDEEGEDLIVKQFDGCASWWTQGPNLRLQLQLAQAVGRATGRYGHVMFPEVANELSVKCAEMLLAGVGKGWARRVFFSDNGSTAVEVALKMAFRMYAIERGLIRSGRQLGSSSDLQILGLTGSYHGDTLGAMDAQAPSVFNGFLQQPWYSGRGVFLEPPKVEYKAGLWRIKVPPAYGDGIKAGELGDDDIQGVCCFSSRDEVFDLGRRNASPLVTIYRKFIDSSLQKHDDHQRAPPEGPRVAALIIETVLHGAGGMEMIDPLFQNVLVGECRKRAIPVVFDEVFTGCWRLGRESSMELLGCVPDIACYAKLMTGGVVPLAATLATGCVFDAFKGDSKIEALLHGHSYSAHPIGCSAAIEALSSFSNLVVNPNYVPDKHQLQELWDVELLREASFLGNINRVTAIGTVFAVELSVSDEASSGYASWSSADIIPKLRQKGIFARPLGNVIYVVVTPTTPPGKCSWLLQSVIDLLRSVD
ncbi:hypothetical protein CBR_g30689 [Chara braunii]|uniref:Uncharacterized protein n=1 Tax=Chara braunii TaxID=69332 RepID=A0A388LDE1_CHABU|nr:hypothetical protein CBR_g30689 [Chara braunii]|eukprot:GBG80321.1 hypothetical protein CBR_g30689 [Chara braunii]